MIYEVKNLSFHYPTSSRLILDDVSITLGEGEILTILGPNGAGKSTLLKCMLGLLRPQKGEIKLCGNDLSGMSERQRAVCVGYVQQTQGTSFGYTVFDYVLMGRSPFLRLFGRPKAEDREIARKALADMGIEHLSDRSINELSGGERQQAMIARVIVGKPKAVLLDEPTAHLDYGNQLRTLRMIKNLKEEGFGVILTTHDPNHPLLLGGRTAIVDRSGKLTVGDTADTVTEDILRRVYSAELRLSFMHEAGRMVCTYPEI